MIFSRNKNTQGFTLVELLVVIAIISLLASVVMASVSQARMRAQYAKAQAEINQFLDVATLAQQERGRLQGITGNGCSLCPCLSRVIKNIPITDSCYWQWINALNTLQNATAGAATNITQMKRDPWGSPYALDENEREGGANDCRLDIIRSAGPNGWLYDGDDVGYTIYPSRPCP